MLNPSFSKIMQATLRTPYVVSEVIATRTLQGNEAFATGQEYRLQPVYGEEIWLKLQRAGLSPQILNDSVVLEVCAGTGFLTYHMLSRCRPRHLVVNDISTAELKAAQSLIHQNYPNVSVDWVLGDMHKVDFGRQFDIIIGNSFLHHFHNVPHVLHRFVALLKKGGVFISLHEPTPMATVVEGAKTLAWPLAVVAPRLINNIVRARYQGEPSTTDLWMFEAKEIEQVSRQSGFSAVTTIPWGLMRPIVVQRNKLTLSKEKPTLSVLEQNRFWSAIQFDAKLNNFLPHRCFGSLCLVCRK